MPCIGSMMPLSADKGLLFGEEQPVAATVVDDLDCCLAACVSCGTLLHLFIMPHRLPDLRSSLDLAWEARHGIAPLMLKNVFLLLHR